MKETLAQLPTDHCNARKLAEGTAHLAINITLQICVAACLRGSSKLHMRHIIGNTQHRRRLECLH